MKRLLDARHTLITLRNEALEVRDIEAASKLDDAIEALNQLPELKAQRTAALDELVRLWDER